MDVVAWFFFWLGIALLGLGVLLLVRSWKERRFGGAVALPLAAGLLLVGTAGQEFILFTLRFGEDRAVESPAFLTVSVITAALATAVWIALGTRRGRQSLRRGAERPQRIRELEVLGAIARLSSQPGSIEQVGGAVLAAAAPAVGVEAAVLLLYDAEHRILTAQAASGIDEDAWRSFRIEASDAFNQQLLSRGGPFVVKDVRRERR
jgi:hypothetical protein